MISQCFEVLPLSIIENATHANLTDGRVLAVSSHRAVGLRRLGTATGSALMATRVFSSDQAP
jgi:hypothetical protein